MLVHKYVDQKGSGDKLAGKRSAGVAAEVNLRILLHAGGEACKGIHPAIETQGRRHQKKNFKVRCYKLPRLTKTLVNCLRWELWPLRLPLMRTKFPYFFSRGWRPLPQRVPDFPLLTAVIVFVDYSEHLPCYRDILKNGTLGLCDDIWAVLHPMLNNVSAYQFYCQPDDTASRALQTWVFFFY